MDGLENLKALERRLDAGWQRIEDAERNGQDVTEWENFWFELMRSYEAACAQLVGG